jgi:hypothetical protein
MDAKALGSIWTFYSYKGGRGPVALSRERCGAAYEVGTWFSASIGISRPPGFISTFEPSISESAAGGVVELVWAHADGENPDWRDYRADVTVTDAPGTIALISAGQLDAS